MMEVLDLFSAAAGGWSLGMHRAGFRTVAACESVPWRRALYAQNNPEVLIYDDVRTLSASRILADLGYFPRVVVGSPPCQDISPANIKGKGVEGERSGLFFEAVRLIGEGRPRWCALENSANLRTRGADAVLAALEGLGYACWAFVVRAGNIGANHERPRSWLIGCDLGQIAEPSEVGCASWAGLSRPGQWNKFENVAGDAPSIGREGGRSRRHRQDGNGSAPASRSDASNASQDRRRARRQGRRAEPASGLPVEARRHADDADAHREGQFDSPIDAEMGWGSSLGGDASEPWADWNGSLAGHLRVDDGLSAWVAGTRIAVGGARGTSAASLIVEAFGDSVVPQIPESIGRAILRTEAALSSVYARAAA